ncbi:hypothetical protein FSARC_9426 [Fusarium sarcochroum]|uniref:Transmembrane protein n=1 Tax=Fusarium sarcochroum TaxID=1208366 RepID=A0A8H4TQX9_9HYPO|nr:hypothetical protein FSARC_9426 [Fusarium sarcochroum]
MTTNSFGGALPRFDFPQQPAPPARFTARAARFFPSAAIVTTAAAACYYAYVYVPNQQSTPAVTYSAVRLQHNQTPPSTRPWGDRSPNAQLDHEGKIKPAS